jgi:hypothetical protein
VSAKHAWMRDIMLKWTSEISDVETLQALQIAIQRRLWDLGPGPRSIAGGGGGGTFSANGGNGGAGGGCGFEVIQPDENAPAGPIKLMGGGGGGNVASKSGK